MVPFQSYIIVGAISAFIAFGSAWQIQGWRYGSIINEQKAEAAKVLVEATEAARANEKAAAERANKIEVQYVEQKDRNSKLLALYPLSFTSAGEFCGCGCGMPGGSETGVSPNESTGSELSAITSEFLRNLAYRCDEAATYAVACKQWADSVK